MSVSLGVVCNLYNEALALPGWLESACRFFDDVRVCPAGPSGAPSTDGTIEILEKWKIPVSRTMIEAGFGLIRSAAVRFSPCDWVCVLDVDERFHSVAAVLDCAGEMPIPDVKDQVLHEYDTPQEGVCPWNWENAHLLGPDLQVGVGEVYSQGAWLRDIIKDESLDAVMTIRRHWRTFKSPAQNWRTFPDYQTRIVRNRPDIFWQNKMHETLMGAKNVYQPNQTHGPFFDHYHLPFKAMNSQQRARDIETYRSIYRGQS